jgi:hypothetical protein
MKTQSYATPEQISIKIIGKLCEVRLTENVEQIETEENTVYQYDEYIFETTYREGLQEKIENNLEAYLDFAKEKEKYVKRAEILKQLEQLDKIVTRVEEDLIAQLQIELHPKKLEVMASKQALRQELAEL